MLGWFKKKRKKDTTVPAPVEPVVEELEQIESSPGQEGADRPTDAIPVSEAASDELSAEQTATLSDEDSSEVVETVQHAVPGPPSHPEPEEEDNREQHREQGRDETTSSKSIFKKLSERLGRTRESFTHRLDELFLGKKEIDADLFDDLEEILVTADLGISTTQELLESSRRKVKRDALSDPQMLKNILKEKIKDIIIDHDQPGEMVMPENGPFVIMVIGVNGVGKTTTIGKIAKKFQNSGQSVLLVAADTFRAAAVSQLKIWGERNEVRVVAQHEGADPSSVVFDAMTVAVSKAYDVVLVDTAGRLHTKANLMEELKKIKRVMNKKLQGAPHEVLLVIDATTGQNGISQALLFDEAVGVSGIALTKLDGTAKGGIVANIARELKTPIRFIGVGEQIDDLRDFDADEFIEALFD